MKANFLDRQPPRSLEAERGVLGSILRDSDALDAVEEIIAAQDFYDVRHRQAFAHLVALRDAGQTFDATMLVERLKTDGAPEFVGAAVRFVAELYSAVATAAHAAYHARIIAEHSRRRQAIALATELLRDAHDADDISSALERHAAEVEAIDAGDAKATLQTAAEACAGALERARDLVEGRGKPAVLSGIDDVDQLAGGFHAGELITIGARPRVGKSAFAAGVATFEAMNGGNVLFFSTEMTADELLLRSLCSASGVSGHALRTGRGSSRDLDRLADAAAGLSQTGLLVDDRHSLSVAEIRATARRLHRATPLTLCVIDYLQRLKPADPRRPRYEAVGQMASDVKSLARELHCPLVLLAQVGRESERSSDGRPTLAMLRESGSIEAESDVVLLLHRPELQKPHDIDLRGKAELIVAKNRNGATGTVDLEWDGPRTLFRGATPEPTDWSECREMEWRLR